MDPLAVQTCPPLQIFCALWNKKCNKTGSEMKSCQCENGKALNFPPKKSTFHLLFSKFFFFGNQVLISVFHSALLNKSKGGGQRRFFFPPWSCLPQLASSCPAGQSVTPSHHWDSHLRFPSPHLIPWIQDEETGIEDRNQKKKISLPISLMLTQFTK